MSEFAPLDFLGLDLELSDDLKKARGDVRKFVSQKITPIIEDGYMKAEFPKTLIPEFASLGLFGTTLSGYDCPAKSYTHYGILMQELERGDSGLRSFVSVQSALSMFPIYKYASESLKKKYLPLMAQGKLIGCFGLTEPDVGSNPAAMKTRVRKGQGGYVLNGHKKWMTNGTMAQLAIVWAKDENEKVNGFIVPLPSEGLTVNELKNKHSLRVSPSAEMIFKDVFVSEEQRLDIIGLKGPFSCLNVARYGIAWGALGAAQACFYETLEYLKNRSQFQKPLASHQLVQAKLANMFTDLTLGQLLCFQLGRLMDSGSATPENISMAKMNNVSKALGIARTCRDLLGANGILSDYQTMRHMNNLETVNTYEGTEDIHRLVLGQFLTGIPAFN